MIGTFDEDGPARRLGFWQIGYGYVDLGAALRLVRSATFTRDLAAKQAAADQRVRRSVGYDVPRSDLWTYDAPRVSVGGTDRRTYRCRCRARSATSRSPPPTRRSGTSAATSWSTT